MNVTSISPIIVSSDRATAVRAFTALLGRPSSDLPVPGTALTETTFSGLSLLSGTAGGIRQVRDLRAAFSVVSLIEAAALLNRLGWAMVGSLGDSSLLVRDLDGNLFEFNERVDA
jgi:hypothetical protein